MLSNWTSTSYARCRPARIFRRNGDRRRPALRYGRVARLLLEIATEQDDRLVVAAKLTQQDITERVGASREMISRIFKDLLVWRLYHHRKSAYRDQSGFTGAAVKLAPL
ncbi:MAG: helix-turn-helix domain-containing protein [Proteobacteria bacterium]|nr:helix-turn-helix domain-containing protein [Pseudomonadota bacterium]